MQNAPAQQIRVGQAGARHVPVEQSQTVESAYVPATAERLGGVKVGVWLNVAEDGTLSVDTADRAEEDNTKPITSAAVYTEIGNINALLATI
nr:MAG TPA_asm: hypothetical protein [Caudoviricetes sp.]